MPNVSIWTLVSSCTINLPHERKKTTVFLIFVCLSRFISSKKSLFFHLGSLKAPLKPKLLQTSPYESTHLNSCFGRANSQIMDLVYEFRSFFFIFSFRLLFWGIFWPNTPPTRYPKFFFCLYMDPDP